MSNIIDTLNKLSRFEITLLSTGIGPYVIGKGDEINGVTGYQMALLSLNLNNYIKVKDSSPLTSEQEKFLKDFSTIIVANGVHLQGVLDNIEKEKSELDPEMLKEFEDIIKANK